MNTDVEHLRLLTIFHYVLAGLIGLFALFPIPHFLFGVFAMLSSEGNSEDQLFGLIFVAFSGIWMLIGISFSVLVAIAGQFLKKRKNYTYCIVVGALCCMVMPFGTILGVFTIIVLMRDSVKELFDYPPLVELHTDSE